MAKTREFDIGEKIPGLVVAAMVYTVVEMVEKMMVMGVMVIVVMV